MTHGYQTVSIREPRHVWVYDEFLQRKQLRVICLGDLYDVNLMVVNVKRSTGSVVDRLILPRDFWLCEALPAYGNKKWRGKRAQ